MNSAENPQQKFNFPFFKEAARFRDWIVPTLLYTFIIWWVAFFALFAYNPQSTLEKIIFPSVFLVVVFGPITFMTVIGIIASIKYVLWKKGTSSNKWNRSK